MRIILAVVVMAAATCWPGPPSQQTTDATVLTGRVVTGSGNDQHPVRRAKVTLTSAAGMTRVTDTDIKGAFRFDRLPAGGYELTVQKAGFVKLEAAASPDATLTLDRAGAIEGTVTDAVGDPVWNVVVRALQLEGGEKLKTVAQVRTDDLGRYRLHSLPAGDYYVETATDQPYLLRLLVMAGEKRPGPNRALYPAASSIEDAKPVRVSLGQDTSAVNLTLTPDAPLKDPAAPSPRPSPDATGTGRITGRVVDAASGKAIRNARVQLLPVDGQRFSILARTDAQGRFTYSTLPARRYTLSAEAERFVTLEFGQKRLGETGTQIQLGDGEAFTADFKLPRASALEGIVLDEFGDPVPNVMAQAALRQYVAGRHRLMPVGGRVAAQVTDDQGHYRISALPPGDYYVAALSGAYTDMNEVGGFAPTYYPGTTDSAAATAVTVTLGADSAAPFSLVPAKTVSVSGIMVDREGKPVAGRGTLWLMTPDTLQRADFNLARGTTAPDGRFLLRNVPEGNYTLQGFGPSRQDDRGGTWRDTGPGVSLAPMNLGAQSFGWLSLTVGDTDLDDVTLIVTSGTSMRGKVVLDDTSLPPPKPEQVRVTAIPVEFDSAPVGGGPPPSETHGDMTFEVTRLSGMRRIFVSVSSPGWTFKKIMRNGFDITDTPQDFRAKDLEGVEVVLSSKISLITGGVSDDKGSVTDYAIVFFPSDPTKWIDRSRFVRMVRPTQQGRFDVRGLPPEDYLVVALPNIVGTEWQDPEFLQELRLQATSFTLMDGEAKTLQLMLKKRP
jgi:5-hydroxyisourate hydrolase-like protein (transthyretin family)